MKKKTDTCRLGLAR